MTKEDLLKEIEKNIRVCAKCRLCKTAKNPVPGEGNPNAEIVFIGEAPGETEDLTGRPFVGRAGKLLEAALAKIGYTRQQVWIGNIIKHRPPQNRDPLPDEILACQGYLAEHSNRLGKLRINLHRVLELKLRFDIITFFVKRFPLAEKLGLFRIRSAAGNQQQHGADYR